MALPADYQRAEEELSVAMLNGVDMKTLEGLIETVHQLAIKYSLFDVTAQDAPDLDIDEDDPSLKP